MNKTPFQRVAEMNAAFGNPKGDPENIDWQRVRSQCKNIHDEYLELLKGLGLSHGVVSEMRELHAKATEAHFFYAPNVIDVRDALADIQVFKDGGLHLMGYDGDRDMDDVVDGVMTRFVKDEDDLKATLAMHAAKGVTDVFVEGEYPTAILKSGSDQPDAPKGKFLKSASYVNTIFRPAP